MKHETLKVSEHEVKWDSWSKSDEIGHRKKRMIDDKHINKLYCDIYEIAPGNINWPLHYHTCNEEVFYILEGQGEVTTGKEVFTVKPGDVVRFPAGEKGAHQLKNISDSQTLKYLDFGTANFPYAC
jgi:uncharacterized cupin superfamily protein